MAINFLAMPALQDPGGYNFKPLADGFDAIREGKKDNRLLDIKQQAQDLDKSRFGLQERQFGAQEQQRKAELMGNQALAAEQLQGPARAAAHARILAMHPNPDSLPPEYKDPILGPRLIAADAGKFRDQQAEALKQAQIAETNAGATLKTAQAQKAGREAEGALTEYGKAGTIVQGPDGKYYSVQFAANGTRKILPIEADGGQPGASRIPLAPARGVQTVDEGTGTRIIDKSTGQDVRSIPKNIAEREAQEEVGKARGKASADLPRVVDNANEMLRVVTELEKHPGLPYAIGVGGIVPLAPGTAQADAITRLEQIKGKSFLEAFNMLKGGGQITEAEGQKATAAIARLERRQTREGFLEALKDLKAVVTVGAERARKQAESQSSNSPSSDGWVTLGNGIRIREKK